MSRFVMSEKTTISAGSALRGLIRGQGDLRIEGQCFGDVEVTGLVEIVEGALVRATIRGARVIVSGAIHGDLYATESISLEAGARVVGNLAAPSVGIGEGALVRGRVETNVSGAGSHPMSHGPETTAPRAVGRPFGHAQHAAHHTSTTGTKAAAGNASSFSARPSSPPAGRGAGASARAASVPSATAATARAPGPAPALSPFSTSSTSALSHVSQAPATQAAARTVSANANSPSPSPSVASASTSSSSNASAASSVAAPSPASPPAALPAEERKAPPPVVPSLKKGHKASFKKKAGG